MTEVTAAGTVHRRQFLKILREQETHKAFFVEPWTYVAGAVILALLNIVLMASTGKAWGVTTSLIYWGASLWGLMGGDPHSWAYFAEVKPAFNMADFGFLTDPGSLTNLGVIFGALLATLLANQFRIKKVKSSKQVVAAVLGGLLMGFGAPQGKAQPVAGRGRTAAADRRLWLLFGGWPAPAAHGVDDFIRSPKRLDLLPCRTRQECRNRDSALVRRGFDGLQQPRIEGQVFPNRAAGIEEEGDENGMLSLADFAGLQNGGKTPARP